MYTFLVCSVLVVHVCRNELYLLVVMVNDPVSGSWEGHFFLAMLALTGGAARLLGVSDLVKFPDQRLETVFTNAVFPRAFE